MKRFPKVFLLVAVLVTFIPVTPRAQSPHPDPQVYGVYPENYQELVTAWLSNGLVDPRSVKVKWLGSPKQGQLTVEEGKQVSGYLVEFTVNARNLFGAYTGPQKHTALIRDGKVVTATGFVYH